MEIGWEFYAFILALFFFHISGGMLAAIFHPDDFSRQSFLLSYAYSIAMGCAIAEYLIELKFWPSMKGDTALVYMGISMILLGELIRKTAILTAKSNFTQDVAENKSKHHQLFQKLDGTGIGDLLSFALRICIHH